MKKTLFWIFAALLSGALLGSFTFDRYENLNVEKVININDKVYMAKYGEYKSEEEMINNISNVERYIYIVEDGKYKAYVGVSTTSKNIKKIVDIYLNKNIKLDIEKITIDNEEFIQNLNEYEKLLDATVDEKSLLIIQNQILSCYEELVVNNE